MWKRCEGPDTAHLCSYAEHRCISPVILFFYQCSFICSFWSKLCFQFYRLPHTATELTSQTFPVIILLPWSVLYNSERDKGIKRLRGYIPLYLCRDLELHTPTLNACDPLLCLFALLPPSSLLSEDTECWTTWRFMWCERKAIMCSMWACVCVCVRERERERERERTWVCQLRRNLQHEWYVWEDVEKM